MLQPEEDGEEDTEGYDEEFFHLVFSDIFPYVFYRLLLVFEYVVQIHRYEHYVSNYSSDYLDGKSYYAEKQRYY